MLTCTAASTPVANRASTSPLPFGLGPRSGLSMILSPIKTPSSRPSLVVRAQQTGGPKRIEPMVTYIERTPCNTSENEGEIRMWFDMPGLAAENIEVEVVDDLLIILGNGDVDAFGNKIFEPYNNRVQLPTNTVKEEITAVIKNGVLYITVPKITKSSEPKVQHIPVRSI
ncbi:small heat shock protein, chloroplastic-like [Chenopodium quinoa]|uniref:small heat shock protein, chloroplastic-like n=1 Tax=Chenopodium quinoa TaxID=63459 RepID=UPI000B793390|nr:small heat shock protein, chloroplastic-like [Chenopodium quinoa]